MQVYCGKALQHESPAWHFIMCMFQAHSWRAEQIDMLTMGFSILNSTASASLAVVQWDTSICCSAFLAPLPFMDRATWLSCHLTEILLTSENLLMKRSALFQNPSWNLESWSSTTLEADGLALSWADIWLETTSFSLCSTPWLFFYKVQWGRRRREEKETVMTFDFCWFWFIVLLS